MKDYNFFHELQKKRGMGLDAHSPAFWGVLVFALILAASVGTVVYGTILNVNLSSVSKELIAVQSESDYQKAREIKERIGLLSEYDHNAGTALEKINKADLLNTKFLNSFASLLPSSAVLQNAGINRATAAFTFTVSDRRTAAELVKNLQGSDLFISSTLVSVASQQGSPGYIAVINSVLKAGGSE